MVAGLALALLAATGPPVVPGVAVHVAEPIVPGSNPCAEPRHRHERWCDTGLDPAQRAAALVSSLTLPEKACAFTTNPSCSVPRLNISSFHWWHEALHGVCYLPTENSTTSFPSALGLASAFNRSLVHAVGAAIGTEGRALTDYFYMGTFWTPNVNIVRSVLPPWTLPAACLLLAASSRHACSGAR